MKEERWELDQYGEGNTLESRPCDRPVSSSMRCRRTSPAILPRGRLWPDLTSHSIVSTNPYGGEIPRIFTSHAQNCVLFWLYPTRHHHSENIKLMRFLLDILILRPIYSLTSRRDAST